MSEEQLTTEQRQELYTLMGQWSRNTDLQFQQVADWTDKQLAQASQQAIADLIPQLEKKRQDSLARADKWEDAKEGDKAHYWLGVAYGQGSAIYLLNSLTPSPALTPKIERRVGKERRDPAGTQPHSWKNGRKGERRKKSPALTKEK